MSTISPFKSIENKYDVYGDKVCMKTFFESLREHKMKMINLKTMKLLTNKQKNPYLNSKICYICKEKLEDKYAKKKRQKIL